MSIIVLAALVAAAPAPAPVPAPVAPVAATTTAAGLGTDARRVCIVHTPSGSFIERKTCQTRETWIAQGTDPLATR